MVAGTSLTTTCPKSLGTSRGFKEDAPRPHAREVFLRLKEMGHEVYLWSSAGGAYAAEAADLLGVSDLVCCCFGKRQEPEVGVDFAVDDDASVVESYGGYRVKPFGGDPRDEDLLRALEAVEASGSSHAPR
jgi:hypothetical protein